MSSKTRKTSTRSSKNTKKGHTTTPAKSVSGKSSSSSGRASTKTASSQKSQKSNLDPWAMNTTLLHLSGDEYDADDVILGTPGDGPVDESCFSDNDWNLSSDLPDPAGTATTTTTTAMAAPLYHHQPQTALGGFAAAAPVTANHPVSHNNTHHPHNNSAKRPLDTYVAGVERTAVPRGNFQPHHKRKKGTKAVAPPKRPLTAYNVFVREECQRSPQTGGGPAALNKKWESMSARERQEYEQMAEQDVERYRREMGDYKLAAATPQVPAKPPPAEKVAASGPSSTIWNAPMMMGPPPPPPPTAAPYPPSWGGFAQPGAEMGGHRGLSGMVPYAAPPSPYRIHPSSHGPPSRRPVEEEAMSPTVSRTVSEDVMTGPPPMGSVPLPSGTQIVIPDVAGNLQKYVVNYAIWTMPESSAKEYVQHMLRMEPQAGGQMMGPGMVSIPSTAIQHRSALRSVSHQAPSHAPPPASFCRLNGRG